MSCHSPLSASQRSSLIHILPVLSLCLREDLTHSYSVLPVLSSASQRGSLIQILCYQSSLCVSVKIHSFIPVLSLCLREKFTHSYSVLPQSCISVRLSTHSYSVLPVLSLRDTHSDSVLPVLSLRLSEIHSFRFCATSPLSVSHFTCRLTSYSRTNVLPQSCISAAFKNNVLILITHHISLATHFIQLSFLVCF